MTILNYTKAMRPQLEDMMVHYMAELEDDTTEDLIRTKLFDFIHKQLDTGIIRISLALDGQTPAGFSVYQIDAPESDWCKRPGWGFIREFYIAPEFRERSFGRLLAQHTEAALRDMGAEKLYLSSGGGVPFWKRCGWKDTGEICSNALSILEKPAFRFEAVTGASPLWQEAKDYAAACSWRAGKTLAAQMDANAFSDWERVILAFSQGHICGFCTVTKTDCIPGLSYTPYIGFVFVEEALRGYKLSRMLLDFASDYLKASGFERVYLISDHDGLYERYGFRVIEKKEAPWGSMEKIYCKEI